MTHGVVYYNKGTKCLIRMATSMSSLRNHYDGKICLLYVPPIDPWFLEFCQHYAIDIKQIPDHTGNALAGKASLWRHSPFDLNLFLDADTLVHQGIGDVWKHIDEHGFITTNFAKWVTTGNKISKRIRSFKPVIGEREITKALKYGDAVNTGVFGWANRDSTKPFLQDWERVTQEGYKHNCTRRMVDEIACQVILHNHKHKLLDTRWNSSVRWPADDPIISHYHGSKHVMDHPPCKAWKTNYWAMRNRHTTKLYDALGVAYGDRRFRRYLKAVQLDDMTIVTAVNDKYFDKLKNHFPKWQTHEGLREQKFIIFYNNLGRRQKRSEFWKSLETSGGVTLIPWEFEPAGDNIRERMLTAFVLGVAKYVKTSYWMKLDCDVRIKDDAPPFTWLSYKNYDIVAHKWGYTKVKGDPDAKTHWLNTLDTWWSTHNKDAQNIFTEIYDPKKQKRVGHRRFCTFGAIEKTAHTKHIAKLAGERLPIPSQDTTSWYVAEQMKLKVCRTNMKRWFAP